MAYRGEAMEDVGQFVLLLCPVLSRVRLELDYGS